MATAVQQSMRWGLGVVVWAVIGSLLFPPAAALHLGIIAISTIMGFAIMMAAVIAITGRSFW